MAKPTKRALAAAEEKRRRLDDVLAAVVSEPPYPDGFDPLAVSRSVLALLPDATGMGKFHAKRLRERFDRFVGDLATYRERLDPVRDPNASFDPGNPDTVGRLVVIALMAQDRVPLREISPTYGSGVYALYYTGRHEAYEEISGTETPIYVGKADPAFLGAATPREQGARLFGRLADHRNSIAEVEAYAEANGLPEEVRLRVDDFDCRRLVCATNAQLVAERHLIDKFSPAWNYESKVCFGISKHGDNAETRRNKMSPWDVLHPGRSWAKDSPLRKNMTADTVRAAVAAHFSKHPRGRDEEGILEVMLDAFRQVGRAPAEVSEAAAESEEVTEAIAENARADHAIQANLEFDAD